jgi:hypothetical protein
MGNSRQLSGTISRYRPNTSIAIPWTLEQYRIILEGLRKKQSFAEITEHLQTNPRGRPGTNKGGLQHHIGSTYEGIEGFLRRFGVTDENEITAICNHYKVKKKGSPLTSTQVSDVRHWEPKIVPKRIPRPLEHDPVRERAKVHRFILAGILSQRKYADIASAMQRAKLPADSHCIEKIMRIHGGVSGFLEFMRYSAIEARKLAKEYKPK